MTKKINQNLTAEQKLILFEEGTERAGSSELNHEKREGSFHCANCGEKLFDSKTKYESGSGWPSFYESLPDVFEIKTDYMLGFFGLIMQLGPIANWGLNIDKKTIEVDTERFETNQKGIYAVGDICNYPGKLKLILSGFHEGALAARACFKLARPNEKYRFEFTTSSKTIKSRLGKKSD